MIYLLLTILGASAVSIVMRLSNGRVSGRTWMLAANYLSCALLAGSFMGFGNVFPDAERSGVTLALGTVNGLFYLLGLLMMQLNIPKNGVVLPSVFSRLGGLMVPLAAAILLFGEIPRITQAIGAAIAIVSIVAINYDRDSAAPAGSRLLLLALFAADGCAGAMSKLFGELGNSALSANYLFFTFATALVLSSLLAMKRGERIGWRELAFGAAIGIPNFFASRFLLKALEMVPAVIAYPTRSVGGIVVISLAGILFFRERLRKRQWAAMAAILAALVLLNV